MLPALRDTDGVALDVTDQAIREAALALAREEGLMAEPTAAAAFAALSRLAAMFPGSRVCCLLTGHGLKDLPFFAEHAAAPICIPPEFDALEGALREAGEP